ncbi:MAG: acetate kinase [Roseovarius sp.]
MAAPHPILVINAGSSSIKAAVFDTGFEVLETAEASGIGGAGRVRVGTTSEACALPDHAAALNAVLGRFVARGVTLAALAGVGHRVVHGGTDLTAPALITPRTRAQIAACIPLAPHHNIHHLAAIDAVARLAPDLPQTASFDTAFHATNPDVARRFALPDVPATKGLQRYGFHGTSYAALTRTLPRQTGAPLPERLLGLHLGNGASLCAIKAGRSVATSMGYSPLSGLTMGTRTGDIDASAVLELARRIGVEPAAHMLNFESGLLGLSTLSADMRTLQEAGTPEAEFARTHFAYWAARHAGSMIAAMGGLDAIAFTGGIGENDAEMRARILDHLRWAGDVPVHIVPAREEAQIAHDTATLLGGLKEP